MAAINDLLRQISDEALRERLSQEVVRINKNKKFGLVFEEHIPECTPLYNIPIRKGSLVAKKAGKIIDLYNVLEIDGAIARCLHKSSSEIKEFPINELVSVAQFGDPIFPSLIPVDKVENSPDSDLWHTLIEADNYHALQLLEYLYPKQVDCIYIDPPYNSGARDWKYNNDYVDSSDSWRHSKWLSMMQKRLKIAKRLLNPSTGVMIVTIDENEVHHLRMLLEEIFPEAYIQMVTIVINPKGVSQGRFSRVEEYAIFCFMPNAYVTNWDDPLLGERKTSKKPRWKGLLRSGSRAAREHTPSEFYPILIDAKNRRIVKA
jgi:adenine-specific DNA-methyltransferase